MDVPLITMEVTTDIAYKIRFMAESGVFGMDTGNVSLNIKDGKIMSIKSEIFRYPQSSSFDSSQSSRILR